MIYHSNVGSAEFLINKENNRESILLKSQSGKLLLIIKDKSNFSNVILKIYALESQLEKSTDVIFKLSKENVNLIVIFNYY